MTCRPPSTSATRAARHQATGGSSAKAASASKKSKSGKSHPHKGHPLSAATKAKISAALKGKKHPHAGHPLSASTKAKISAKLKGRHHPGHKGGHHSGGGIRCAPSATRHTHRRQKGASAAQRAAASRNLAKYNASRRGTSRRTAATASRVTKKSSYIKGTSSTHRTLSAATKARISASLRARKGKK